MSTYHIEFITPLFSRGAYEDRPEIRPASIRGQLHWWFRALGGSYADERAVFGGVHGGATASKIVIRTSNVTGTCGEIPTLPHKHGGQASPKHAFRPGASFDLHVLSRLGGINEDGRRRLFSRTLEAWLLLGSIGLRSTRGGGSFRWTAGADAAFVYPESFTAYAQRCADLLQAAPLRFALLNRVYTDAEQARRDISDTLGGRDDRAGQTDLERLRYPLGRVFDGRKTSPLRFRVVGVGTEYRIAAIWDGRNAVTGNQPTDLPGVIRLLAQRDKEIGRQLAASPLAQP